MNRLVVLAVTLFGVCGPLGACARGEVTAEQVRKAIERGTAYLLAQQFPDGWWPENVDQPGQRSGYRSPSGGVTALGTLALLNAGIGLDHPQMRKALDSLRARPAEQTYTVALQTMVFARAEPAKERKLIERNVRWLQKAQIARGPSQGAWSYGIVGKVGDNSNSQFALLALYEAERVGVTTPDQTWLLAQAYWERCQKDDGSWGYGGKWSSEGTGSMMCAGIAALIIAADRIHTSDAQASGNQILCCRAPGGDGADRIERAMQCLGQHYSVTTNPGKGDTWWLYYLYGLERVGRLTGRRFIPLPSQGAQARRADWFREGAEVLVNNQDGAGAWSETPSNSLVGTSFALLFLSKGRWPTLLAKVQYEDGDEWNRHRRDAANLTRYVETRWRRDLTWQVMDLRLASIDDLLQTPVLYLSGSNSPLPSAAAARKELAQKLRAYLDRGGFLMAEANCGCAEFDQGFRELMALVFPEPEYKLRPLEPEHPIWHAEEEVDARYVRPLWGIDFDCRTSVVYAPADPPRRPRPSLSCLWELSRPGREVKFNPAVQQQIDAALSLGVNMLAYATNRALKTKDDFFHPTPPPAPRQPAERGRLEVANLRHPGGCTMAPRALQTLMEAAGGNLKLRARARPELLDLTDPALFDYHLVFMHGRNAFGLTDAERQQLRLYLERGGMLFAGAICGSREFCASFRREMEAIFPNRKLEPIPATDPLWSTTYGGFDLRDVARREPGKRADAALRRGAPELEGIKHGDRWCVVFSPHDLSCALEKKEASGCPGYTREDAARIGINVVLYSLEQ